MSGYKAIAVLTSRRCVRRFAPARSEFLSSILPKDALAIFLSLIRRRPEMSPDRKADLNNPRRLDRRKSEKAGTASIAPPGGEGDLPGEFTICPRR